MRRPIVPWLLGLVACASALVLVAPAQSARKATKVEYGRMLQAVARFDDLTIVQPYRLPINSEGFEGEVMFPACVSTVNPTYGKARVHGFGVVGGQVEIWTSATYFFRLGRGRARVIGVVGGVSPPVPLPRRVRDDIDRDLDRKNRFRNYPCGYKGAQAKRLITLGLLPILKRES